MALQNKKRIALDSSILLAINETKVDLFERIKEKLGKVAFVVPKAVIEELKKLKKKNKKLGRSVKIAERLIKINKCKILRGKREADEALKDLGRKGFIVATADKELKKSIKKNNGKVLFIRQKKYVLIE